MVSTPTDSEGPKVPPAVTPEVVLDAVRDALATTDATTESTAEPITLSPSIGESAETPAIGAPEKPEVVAGIDRMRACTFAALNLEDISVMTPEHKAFIAEHIIDHLRTAVNAEARVRLFSRYADLYGLDFVLSSLSTVLGLPGASDLLVTSLQVAYLLAEAHKAGLSGESKWKIIKTQAADAAIGSIPLIGDFMDLFYKANRKSWNEFRLHAEHLASNALAAGVPKEIIDELIANANKVAEEVDVAVQMGVLKGDKQIKGPQSPR